MSQPIYRPSVTIEPPISPSVISNLSLTALLSPLQHLLSPLPAGSSSTMRESFCFSQTNSLGSALSVDLPPASSSSLPPTPTSTPSLHHPSTLPPVGPSNPSPVSVLNGSSPPPPPQFSLYETLIYSKNQALKGGLAGASAQVLNVFALMWLRTTMNYQYRYGGRTRDTIAKLWKEGGVPRFYRGLIPALMQSPLSRFGDTAANVGVLTFLDSHDSTKALPVGLKTAMASAGAAGWRLFLMPIDAWKTIKQVEGGEGIKALKAKVATHGISKLYHGSMAAMSATFVGHYPWFFTHNFLSQNIDSWNFAGGKHLRNACIGFCSSVVSDTCSNSIRVIKTTKQTSLVPLSYSQTIKEVVSKDGLLGLFGRGLGTRIATNGMQGMMFSVGWKAINDMLDGKK